MPTPEHEKPVAFKITPGYVRQDYVDGKCVGQSFIAGDDVAWENEIGDAIDPPSGEQYQPFDMVQPEALEACQRCDSALTKDGHCTDETCPFSDTDQDDERGWAGHPERDRNWRNDE